MTLLLPTTDVLAPAPVVSLLLNDVGSLAGLKLPGGWECVPGGDDNITMRSQEAIDSLQGVQMGHVSEKHGTVASQRERAGTITTAPEGTA
jgi:hypothetical protein